MVMACIVYLDFCFEPTEVHNVEASCDQWLPDWLNHLISGSHSGTIPMESRHTQTRLNKAAWQHHLQDYPYQDLVKFFLESISNGFWMGYNGSTLQSTRKNLTSAIAYPDVVDKYLYHSDKCQVHILVQPAQAYSTYQQIWGNAQEPSTR